MLNIHVCYVNFNIVLLSDKYLIVYTKYCQIEAALFTFLLCIAFTLKNWFYSAPFLVVLFSCVKREKFMCLLRSIIMH